MEDGRLSVAVAEERLSRDKHDSSFPEHAIRAVLEDRGLTPADLGAAVFHEKPVRKLDRIATTALTSFPHALHAFAVVVPDWLRKKLWVRFEIEDVIGRETPILMGSHHRSHAAAAFCYSPFDEAAVVTVDGVGEWSTATWGVGRGSSLELMEEQRYPHSLGLLYSAITSHLGYPINDGEGTIMGLAPHGEPAYREVMERIAPLAADGSVRLDPRIFPFARGRTRMFSGRLERLLGPRRPREDELDDRHRDIAASLQVHVEEALLRTARHVHAKTGLSRLCLGGGVALNSVANGRLSRESPFDEVHVAVAPGDDGACAGAAADVLARLHGRRVAPLVCPFLGPEPPAPRYEGTGARTGLSRAEVAAETVRLLARGAVVGLFSGRCEFGPRSLGARSILADPRDPGVKDRVNGKIKFREGFRPFAPAVLAEKAEDHFVDVPRHAGFMSFVCDVQPASRDLLPGITHVDGTARLQTVEREAAPFLHEILTAFDAAEGCPVLLNTSFNRKGEPIVQTYEQAAVILRETGLDALVTEESVWVKEPERFAN